MNLKQINYAENSQYGVHVYVAVVSIRSELFAGACAWTLSKDFLRGWEAFGRAEHIHAYALDSEA